MSIHKLSLKLFGGLAIFVLPGCSSDDLGKVFDGGFWGNNDEIGFVIYSGGVKGSETNSSNYLSRVSDFQVWGYLANGGRYLGSSDTQGVKIVGDGNGSWDYSSSGDKKYWGSASLNFEAVTPASDASFTIENSVSSSLAHVVANVTVPTDNASQKDIMFASAAGVTKNTAAGKVNLPFKHAMSLISFSGKVANTNYIVELGTVNLHNINNKGKVGYLSSADASGAVNLSSSVTTGTVATYSLGMVSDKTLSSTTTKNITAFGGSLIMLPQTTTKWNTSSSSVVSIATADQNKQSYISVTYKVKTTSGLYIIGSESSYSTLYIPFAASWQQGKKYNYTLVFGSGSGGYDANGKAVAQNIKFQVSEDAWVGVGNDTTIPGSDWDYYLDVVGTSDYSYVGGSNTYKVTSYKSFKGTNVAAAWTASLSTDGGATWSSTAPSWLSSFTASGNGGTSASSYTAKVAKAEGTLVSSESATDKLKAATAVSNYDLSTHTVSGASCSMTTANCYMVHAAGTYKIPLVYGNAIKNGAVNTEAFNPIGTSGDNFLKPFVNHADAGITDPWLKNNGATPDGAKLIWQDSNGLISAVGISGDYLTFTVPSANIAEGNAVIAATKGGTVVWSWHIWVTPETLSTLTSIAGTSYTYKVTPVNLGWVSSGDITTTNYYSRSCLVKITQSGGGLSKTFSVVQNGGDGVVEIPKQGVSTYYQWGRKDPDIPAAAYNSKSNHAAYDISGGSVSPTYLQSSVAIGTTIQNPLIHYYSSSTSGPYSTYQYNLWDANNTANGQIKTKTVKTIYDPCPPGFCIPTSDLWYVMTGYGANSSGSWDSTNLGRLWTDNTPNLFFPASGLRSNSSGSLTDVGSGGYYWSASPYGSNGHDLYLDSSYWFWFYDNRACGFPVRAVLEE